MNSVLMHSVIIYSPGYHLIRESETPDVQTDGDTNIQSLQIFYDMSLRQPTIISGMVIMAVNTHKATCNFNLSYTHTHPPTLIQREQVELSSTG